MSKNKLKIEVTDAQLEALLNMADDIKAMIGGGDDDAAWKRNLRLFKNMCETNFIEWDGLPKNLKP